MRRRKLGVEFFVTTLHDIVKRHHETGCYGAAHLRMGQSVLDETKRTHPSSPSADPLALLMAIPVVVDEGIPGGEWRLVDTASGAILAIGWPDSGAARDGGGQ